MSGSSQVVAEKRMWCSKVRVHKDKHKNNQLFSPISSVHAILFNALKTKKKRILKERKGAVENIQDYSFALSTF